MPKPRTYPKGKRVCIFCEGKSGAPLSHEHIFPDWLRDVFHRSPTATHLHGITSWADGDLREIPIAQNKKQGVVASRQVRVVCRKCNNDWLSQLETRSKDLLLTLLHGKPITLGKPEQLALATWIAKTVMAAEYVDRTKVAIPQTDRTLFMDTLAPPPKGWWIWIAGSRGARWRTGLHHLSSRANFEPVDPETRNIPNLQSTTIGLGALLAFCVTTTWPNFSGFELSNPDRSDLKPIWPLTDHTIIWPPPRLLDDDGINFIARNLLRAFPSRGRQG